MDGPLRLWFRDGLNPRIPYHDCGFQCDKVASTHRGGMYFFVQFHLGNSIQCFVKLYVLEPLNGEFLFFYRVRRIGLQGLWERPTGCLLILQIIGETNEEIM